MANKELFGTTTGRFVPPADAVNEAGGVAYKMADEHALAQYACTGCLNSTYYANAETQLSTVLELAKGCSDDFVAKTAIYARKVGFMKDLPALLCAVLAGPGRQTAYLAHAFKNTIDNAKMLRNFVQIIRSGVVGRKSLGTQPRRLVREWLESRAPERLFRDSVGQDPSLADVIKMVHPKPADPKRALLYRYLLGKESDAFPWELPQLILDYENFKSRDPEEDRGSPPNVPFQMLTALKLGRKEWTEIAVNAPWQMTRMNLNTFMRHDVFKDDMMIQMVAKRLRDPGMVARSRCFPYQLLMAYKAADQVPHPIQEALQDAMEIAIANVPKMKLKIYVCPDVSGSMHAAVTGKRKGSTTKVKIVDVAGLIAAALLRSNPETSVLPFEHRVVPLRLNSRDSVMTNAQKLASIGGGSTNCSAPLQLLNESNAIGDLVIYVSDYESWIDVGGRYRWGQSGTETMRQWGIFKGRNPKAQMICIDVQPNRTTQAKELPDVYNVGGFSDQVFNFIAAVAEGKAKPGFWVDQIKKNQLLLEPVPGGDKKHEATDVPADTAGGPGGDVSRG